MRYLPELPGVWVGSPITDNILYAATDGRFSVGWRMLWNAPRLNPSVKIAN